MLATGRELQLVEELVDEGTDEDQVSPAYSRHRIRHKHQVIRPRNLKKGKRYYQAHLNDSGNIQQGEIEIVSVDTEKNRYIARHYSSGDSSFIICELEHSLADFGVAPYENGMWNTRNWLVRK